MARTVDLPPLADDVVVVRGDRGVLAAREPLVDGLVAAGFGPDGAAELPEADVGGRRPLLELEVDGQPLLVRRFQHGGVLRAMTGARFRDPRRPFLELALSDELRGRGVATPEVVAARARAAPAFGWRLELATRRVEGAVDVGRLLGDVRRGALDRRALRSLCDAAGRFLRALHDLGLFHADLQPANLLVRDPAADPPELLVLDLDRSRLDGALDGAAKRANLERLWRYVARREERYGAVLAAWDVARFLRAYAGDGWRSTWRAVAAAHRRGRLLHRIGWFLEDPVGRRVDGRAVV